MEGTLEDRREAAEKCRVEGVTVVIGLRAMRLASCCTEERAIFAVEDDWKVVFWIYVFSNGCVVDSG
jgi:hypothetical protein